MALYTGIILRTTTGNGINSDLTTHQLQYKRMEQDNHEDAYAHADAYVHDYNKTAGERTTYKLMSIVPGHIGEMSTYTAVLAYMSFDDVEDNWQLGKEHMDSVLVEAYSVDDARLKAIGQWREMSSKYNRTSNLMMTLFHGDVCPIGVEDSESTLS